MSRAGGEARWQTRPDCAVLAEVQGRHAGAAPLSPWARPRASRTCVSSAATWRCLSALPSSSSSTNPSCPSVSASSTSSRACTGWQGGLHGRTYRCAWLRTPRGTAQ